MIAQTRIISVIALTLICYLTIIGCSSFPINAQQPDSNRLPILLIHGYAETSSIWNLWIDWLEDDHFSKVYPITFNNDDQCGSTEQHATELRIKVDRILSETGKEKVNIIAHSKGGLDARWYIANNGIDKVANLIMIGTPNAGTSVAAWDFTGCPLGSSNDLLPGSSATEVVDRPQSTHYYTIAGNWLSNNTCWINFSWVFDGGNCFIPGADDGLVPVESVESRSYYIPLGEPLPYDHFDLLKQMDVYERVFPILNR